MSTTSKANLADRIFADLQRQILTDTYAAGQRMPSERDLAQTLNTNRNTLREAIRKLEQTRLVKVRHGAGVTVEDFRQTALMDVLVPFLEHGRDTSERVGIILDLLAMRTEIIGVILGFAAERHTDDDLARLEALCVQQLAAFEAEDKLALSRGDVAWLDALVDAAHSLTTRWVTNSVLDAYRQLAERLPAMWRLEPSYPEMMHGVLAAIRDGDADTARALTRAYYERNDARVGEMLAPLVAAVDFGEPRGEGEES